MESTLSVDKNRLAGQQQQQRAVQQNQPTKVELVEEDVSNSINEASSYERHLSPSGQQLQLGTQHPLEPSFQVKATKSVLFDTRSTTHAHNKKVQSGKKKKKDSELYCTKYHATLILYASVNVRVFNTVIIISKQLITLSLNKVDVLEQKFFLCNIYGSSS